jgi:hypothetical protein
MFLSFADEQFINHGFPATLGKKANENRNSKSSEKSPSARLSGSQENRLFVTLSKWLLLGIRYCT